MAEMTPEEVSRRFDQVSREIESSSDRVNTQLDNMMTDSRHKEMIGLLASINNQLGSQTGFLADIEKNQEEAEQQAEADSEAQKRAQQESTVTDDDGAKKAGGMKGVFGSVMGGVSGAVESQGGKLGLLGKLGLAAALTPMLGGFIDSLVKQVSDGLFGGDEEGARKSIIESAVGTGGLYALLGGFFSKRLILPAFFAGAFSEIFQDLEGNKYIGKLGLDAGQLNAIGLAIGGTLGLFIPRLLTRTIPGVIRGAATAMNTGARGFATAAAVQTATATGVSGQAGRTVPRGMRVNSAGRVVNATTGRFTSVDALEKAMKAEKRGARFAKYSKFFKFLKGGALAILPSLFDVAMAIYNDAPPDEVKKQLSGVLGAAGGLAIGSLGGMALGTAVFPGLGTLIGGFLGGTIGALSGEKLIETITGSLLSGKDVDKPRKLGGQRRREQRANLKNKAAARAQLDAMKEASGGATPTIAPTEQSQANIVAQTQTMTTPSGGFIDATSTQLNNILSGGNTNSQTNVGGSSTTFNIVNGSSNSLSNAPHLPVPQAS